MANCLAHKLMPINHSCALPNIQHFFIRLLQTHGDNTTLIPLSTITAKTTSSLWRSSHTPTPVFIPLFSWLKIQSANHCGTLILRVQSDLVFCIAPFYGTAKPPHTRDTHHDRSRIATNLMEHHFHWARAADRCTLRLAALSSCRRHAPTSRTHLAPTQYRQSRLQGKCHLQCVGHGRRL